MIFIETSVPAFCYKEHLFSKSVTSSCSVLNNFEEFKEVLENYKLHQNIPWISSTILELKNEELFEEFLKIAHFPFGAKGVQAAKDVTKKPYKDRFKFEPFKVWKILMKLPDEFVMENLTPYSGSKLKELASLSEEIYRIDKILTDFSSLTFEEAREKLLQLRYPTVSHNKSENLSRLKTLPHPWKAQIIGMKEEQKLQLTITVSDKTELDRAKLTLEKSFGTLEQVMEELT